LDSKKSPFNSSGQVIGINTILYSGALGDAQGIGFALPINMVRQVADELIKNGNPEQPTDWLGISMQDITQTFARQYRLPVQEGVLVVAVMPDSPAEKAGLLTMPAWNGH
jgi:serine protease Do